MQLGDTLVERKSSELYRVVYVDDASVGVRLLHRGGGVQYWSKDDVSKYFEVYYDPRGGELQEQAHEQALHGAEGERGQQRGDA